MNYGIIVAAGKSERVGHGVDKAFLSLGTKPVLAYSLEAYEKCPEIDGIILVVRKDRLDSARGLVQIFGISKVKRIIAGGIKRQFSVGYGLEQMGKDVSIVSVHDGARPCVTPQLISETIKSAKKHGSGVAAVKITDTIKQVDRGMTVAGTVDRSKLWAVQTPQTFKTDLLKKAFAFVNKKKMTVTDEASAVECVSNDIRLVESSPMNIKITTANDLPIAAALLKI